MKYEIRIYDANGGRCDCYQFEKLDPAVTVARLLFNYVNSVYKCQVWNISQQRILMEMI